MKKQPNKTLFKLKCGYEIYAWSERTRYGFRHIAELYDTKLNRIARSTASYYNRTWESFTFETVIRQVLGKASQAFDKAAVDAIMERLNAEARGQVEKEFKFVAGMAKAMSLFTDNQADANKAQKRIMAAGLPGIQFPADWDALPEAEKKRRMDKALEAGCEPL
jgi:hypothetical protein